MGMDLQEAQEKFGFLLDAFTTNLFFFFFSHQRGRLKKKKKKKKILLGSVFHSTRRLLEADLTECCSSYQGFRIYYCS